MHDYFTLNNRAESHPLRLMTCRRTLSLPAHQLLGRVLEEMGRKQHLFQIGSIQRYKQLDLFNRFFFRILEWKIKIYKKGASSPIRILHLCYINKKLAYQLLTLLCDPISGGAEQQVEQKHCCRICWLISLFLLLFSLKVLFMLFLKTS